MADEKPMSTAAMLQSYKATHRAEGKGKDMTSPSASEKKAAKVKKLSEKGKTKLALHRAEAALAADYSQLESAYVDQHPELVIDGVIDMPAADVLFADGLDGQARLDERVKLEKKNIENEEIARKIAKTQKQHNVMKNAQLKGNKAAENYNAESIDLRVVQKELKKTKEREKNAVIVLEEALPLIRNATDAAAVGQKSLLRYLEQESILQEFNETDMRYLRASLDAELERRNSPINFRVEILWRLAATLHDFQRGGREQNLRLAMHIYVKLIERCDEDLHPFQFAGLHNSLELCEIELERVTGYKILERANADYEAGEDDASATFNFMKKEKPAKSGDKKKKKSSAASEDD